jgi:hypothetical protein
MRHAGASEVQPVHEDRQLLMARNCEARIAQARISTEHHFEHTAGREPRARRSHFSHLGASGAGALHCPEATDRQRAG